MNSNTNNSRSSTYNYDSDDDIKHDTPVFRSVALPPRAPLFREPISSSSHRQWNEAATVATTAAVETKNGTMKPSFNNNNNFVTPPPPPTTSWAPLECLRKISWYHPLEPSHATFALENLSTMLTKLTRGLRDLSCHVVYDDNRLAATCRTMEAVEFHVSLLQGTATTTKSSGGRPNHSGTASNDNVVMEIQRIAGDSFLFHSRYARPLLAIVKDQDSTMECATTTRPSNKTMGRTLDNLSAMQHPAAASTVTQCGQGDIEQALELASDLILCDRYDAKQLGLESMAHLTSPTQTGYHTALTIARALTSDVPSPLVRCLWEFLLNQQNQQQEADASPSDWNLAALQVWSQVWQVLAEDRTNSGTSGSSPVLPDELAPSVIQLLCQYMEHVHSMPHHATYAMQGLQALVQLDPRIAQCIPWKTVQQAQAWGATQHAALHQASGQLLMTVQG